MNKLVLKNKLYVCFLLGCLFGSLLLNYFVFKKSAPNFPVILRTNDFGTNFLANRYVIWQISILGIILILINTFLSRFLKRREENLSKLLFFATIGIAILLLLISIQIYFLNR
ncbi:MAG: hypothetical protein WC306_01225 [Candidatus Paceibacterota bacterium]|jgi:hypothetical protein